MEGIVRELSGRKVIQFPELSLLGKKIEISNFELEPREYNGTVIYSAGGMIKSFVNVGDKVITGELVNDKYICTLEKRHVATVASDNSGIEQRLDTMIELLREFIKMVPKIEKVKVKEEDPIKKVYTIHGIKCRINPEWNGTNDKFDCKYVPNWECTVDDDRAFEWSKEFNKINGLEIND